MNNKGNQAYVNNLPDTLDDRQFFIKQAERMLDKCGYVILSTVNEYGFPRPVAIDVLRHEGISVIWMTTFLSSEKVKHIRKNAKAGTCAGQGIGRKMGFTRKWNYTEYLHFSDYMAAFATHRTAFSENLHHNRTVQPI